MDNFPVTCSSVARFFHIKGSTLERNYKESLSEFDQWDQKGHATDWVLLAKNLGEYDSIDDDVYTIFSNKAGHGGKGTIVAVVKGTKAEVVSRILKMIPLAEREKVKEVTMDFSDSMYAIVRECFPPPSSSTASTSCSGCARLLTRCACASSGWPSQRRRRKRLRGRRTRMPRLGNVHTAGRSTP